MRNQALLALEDGTVFHGESIGASGQTVGEVVFNTALTGYQEILTDPSYRCQLVTLTYPHIGNVGVNPGDAESCAVQAAGLIVRDCPRRYSNWRATQSLERYLMQSGVVAIAGIDTRALTRRLREQGALAGCMVAADTAEQTLDIDAAVAAAGKFGSMAGQDLARDVGVVSAQDWDQGGWRLEGGFERRNDTRFHVVAYDFGIKRNILRLLVEHDCHVTLVPATTPVNDVFALRPDGVFLSNGPGDPEPCSYAIEAAKVLMKRRIPLFGICLGHQIMGLASGARTVKMKFGHHGANHPVIDLRSGRVMISSQNHGFAVDETTLPECLFATHRSLFDGSLQGIERKDCPAFGFQGHPEASPGPHDLHPLFAHFIHLMQHQAA